MGKDLMHAGNDATSSGRGLASGIPWAAGLCHFFHTTMDMEIIWRYFIAGLEVGKCTRDIMKMATFVVWISCLRDDTGIRNVNSLTLFLRSVIQKLFFSRGGDVPSPSIASQHLDQLT
jgi:hypothetical protein